MKHIISILIISFFASCKSDLTNKETELKNMKISGTWRFQSSTKDYIKDHLIIILDDNSYYKFSIRNGGRIIGKGFLSKEDSLIDQREFKYGLKKLDTNRIEIENHYSFFGDFTNTYRKTHYSNYKDELKK